MKKKKLIIDSTKVSHDQMKLPLVPDVASVGNAKNPHANRMLLVVDWMYVFCICESFFSLIFYILDAHSNDDNACINVNKKTQPKYLFQLSQYQKK